MIEVKASPRWNAPLINKAHAVEQIAMLSFRKSTILSPRLALGGARAFMTVPKQRAEEPASAVAAGAEDFGAPEKALPLAPSKDSKDWTLPVAPPKDSKDWKALPPAPPKDGKALPPSPTAKRPEVPPPPI